MEELNQVVKVMPELVGANRYAVYDRGRFRPDGQGGGTYQFDKPQWRLKGGGPEYDNPKGIHPDQLMRMYQGDNNKIRIGSKYNGRTIPKDPVTRRGTH